MMGKKLAARLIAHIPTNLLTLIRNQTDVKFMLVGGAVRDAVMSIDAINDLDFEVFNVGSFEHLVELLLPLGRIDVVGKDFGVAKLYTAQGIFDFSLPRRERHISAKHNDVNVDIDPCMSFEDAALRRDFTTNALMFDVQSEELLDFHNGLEHIRNRMLHPVCERFKEDPLRVLRGMQFASRFNMWASPLTVHFALEMTHKFKALPKERVAQEWIKWAKGKHPDMGLKFLQATWISCFPELASLQGVPQDTAWHPEGDAWEHTIQTVAARAKLAEQEPAANDDEHVQSMFEALAHDLGKPDTTVFDERWRSPGHDKAGIARALQFGSRIFAVNGQKELHPIVKAMMDASEFHMRFKARNEVTRKSVRRVVLAMRQMTIAQLRKLIIADISGRPFTGQLVETLVFADKLVKVANSMGIVESKPKGIVGGKHLIARGLKPGILFGKIIRFCEEAEMEHQAFIDEISANVWLDENLDRLIDTFSASD